jgi:ABC-type dipeptide/oligopeptide/nickel transport system ATPase subunit
MAQALHSPQRYRGFVLTSAGMQKLHEQVKRIEAQTRLRQSPRTIAERVQLSEPSGIHPITVRKIFNGVNGVDKRSIQLVFQVLQLQLEDRDCAHAGLCKQAIEILPEASRSTPVELDVEVSSLPKHQEWLEVVDGSSLCGRVHELDQLNQAITTKRCRLVHIIGMAGVGKTALTTMLARKVQPEFETVIWKSLHHAPAVQTVLKSILQSLIQQTGRSIELPTHVEELTRLLIEKLQNHRCLLVFDHFNSILCGEQYAGYCRPGYEAYGEFLKIISEVSHQSCLIITSREMPRAFGITEENYVRSLQLDGLSISECQQMLTNRNHLIGAIDDWKLVTELYNGNPLILKIVASHIQNYFNGSIFDYLKSLKPGQVLFNNLRDLLSQQFDRLSPLERELVYYLALYRKPVSISQLCEDIVSSINQQLLLEGLDSLSRRSLLHRQGTYVSLDPMISTYVSECFREQQDSLYSICPNACN